MLLVIEIPQEFVDWAVKQLRNSHDEQVINRKAIRASVQNTYSAITRKIDNLLSMFIGDDNKNEALISSDEYKHQKGILLKEKSDLEEQLQGLSDDQNNWLETAEQAFNFAHDAAEQFKQASLDEKRMILTGVGSNFILEDKILRFDWLKPFSEIQEASNQLKHEKATLEPKSDGVLPDTRGILPAEDVNSVLWGPQRC